MLKQYPRTKVFDKYIINQETRDIAFVDNKGKKHKTLVDQFAYPHNGSGTL